MRLAGLAAALALAVLPAVGAAQNVAITLAPGEVLLKVEAEGEHLSRPDVMEITAGVVTTGRSAKEALSSNNVLANRLLAEVRQNGIAPRDVQTSELSVTPQFASDDSDGGEEARVRRITGYVARNRLRIHLRELNRASDIVSALFEAGANEVQGPSFGLSDEAPALLAARRAAVAAARAEADSYADALGMRVSRVLRVSEERFETEGAQYITVTGSRVRPTPLEPGEVATTVEVYIDYAMVPR